MVHRLPLCGRLIVSPLLLVAALYWHPGRAYGQIYNDQTNQVIPGTENITLGPGIDLSNWNTAGHTLEYADFDFYDLSGANFSDSDLNYAAFQDVAPANANFTGATILGDTFSGDCILTASQLYSTASYQSQNLSQINVQDNDLRTWNLVSVDLASSYFYGVNFGGVDLSATNLTHSTIFGCDLTGASLKNANLTNCVFDYTNLTNTDFTGAIVNGTHFELYQEFAASQLYSTASYQTGNLEYIDLGQEELAGWNFVNQDLSHAILSQADLTGADLRGANLTLTQILGANLTNANLSGAYFNSTAFEDANLTDANLAGASIDVGTFANANFADADLRGATTNQWPNGAITHDTINSDGTIPGLAMNAGELLTVRNNPLPIKVTSSAQFNATSIIQFLLEGDWTSPVELSPGTVTGVAGTLDLEFADGADPAALLGDTFHIFGWNGTLPAGDQFAAITTAPGVIWDTSELYTNGDVTLVAIPEPTLAGIFTGTGAMLIRRKRRAPDLSGHTA